MNYIERELDLALADSEQENRLLKQKVADYEGLIRDLTDALRGQRTWVGLTDDEISEFDTWHDNREEAVGWCNPSEIVAYIEAKLKEKNT
jgi:hypothetical protein